MTSVALPAWQLRGTARAEPLLKAGLVFAVLALTALDRFGLQLTDSWALPASTLAMYVLVAAMLASGAAELNPKGVAAFVGVVGVASLSFLVNHWFEPRPHQSITAWMLVVLSYAPFAVALAPGAADPRLWRWMMRLFIHAAVLVAAAGIAQFFVQFVYHPSWLFDYTPLIPEAVRTSGGWNTVNPVSNWVRADGYWIKANGFFLREPSIFSLLLALAIVSELALGARKWVLGVLAAGLVLSYSGSGILALAVAMAFPIGVKTVLRFLALGAVAAALVILFGDALNLQYTLNRIGEFGSEKSSAYCRFIHPALAVAGGIDSDAWSALLGHGSGSMIRSGVTCESHQPTYGKLLFEYGLAGAIAFGALLWQALQRSAAPLRLRAALAVSWLFLGGNLVTSEVLTMVFLFSAMWPPGAAALGERGR